MKSAKGGIVSAYLSAGFKPSSLYASCWTPSGVRAACMQAGMILSGIMNPFVAAHRRHTCYVAHLKCAAVDPLLLLRESLMMQQLRA